MGRPKRDTPYRIRQRRGRPYEVLFTLDDGRDFDLGLGTYDRDEAQRKALEKYLAALAGTLEPEREHQAGRSPVIEGKSTSKVGAQWLASTVGVLRATTRETCELYIYALETEMPTTANWSVEAFERLLAKRLAKMQAKTVRKEFSCYRQLVAYAHKNGYIPAPITVPSVPVRAKGTRYSKARRCAADEHSPEDILALIAALPEWSRRDALGNRYPIRARFVLGYYLALRPEVLNVAKLGVTWSPGRTDWWIPKEHDKIGIERMIDLPPECVKALEALQLEGDALIFGRHRYKRVLLTAALEAKMPKHKANRLCPQHMRSAGGTHLLEQSDGDITGVQYVLGHLHMSTTARYMRTSARAGSRAMAKAAAKRAAAG